MEWLQPARLPDGLQISDANAKSRKHPREWMDEDPLDPQGIRHRAGMLSPSAAEACERIARHVMPSCDGDLPYCRSHVVDGYLEKALRNFIASSGAPKLIGNLLQATRCSVTIKRLITTRPKDSGELRGVNTPKEQIAIGHRQRAASTITGRPRICAGTFGSDPETHAIEAADGAAARGNRVDLHHRRPDPNTSDEALIGKLEGSRVMRDVGRRSAHVEADQPIAAMRLARGNHSNDAPCRARKNCILATKGCGLGETAVRLHEVKI